MNTEITAIYHILQRELTVLENENALAGNPAGVMAAAAWKTMLAQASEKMAVRAAKRIKKRTAKMAVAA